MKKLFLLIIFTFALLSKADCTVFIEQGKIVHPIIPGTNVTGTVTVHNAGDDHQKVRVYWEDFEYVQPFDGTKKFTPALSSKYSLASWIKFTPQELDMPPFARKEISYVIDTPEDFQGGRYGVMFFEPMAPQVDIKTGMNLVSRVGSIFFLESTDKSKTVMIENFTAGEKGIEADFSNRGNVIIIPEATFYVMSDDGRAVDRGDVPKIYVPPGATAKYKINFNNDFPAGNYTIILTVDLQEEDVIVKEIDIEGSPNSGLKVLGSRD
jgi:hypothetical protein